MMQYGLFSYETENIGDEIQSIAARRSSRQWTRT